MDEITLSVTLQASKNGADASLVQSASPDMTGDHMVDETLALTTTPQEVPWGAIPAGDRARYAIYNMDSIEKVIVATANGSGEFAEVDPGEAMTARRQASATVWLDTASGSANVAFVAVAD